MSGEVQGSARQVASLIAFALATALVSVGLASCGSGAAAVRSAEQHAEAPTSAASSSSESIPADPGGTTDGVDVAAVHAKVVKFLADNPKATVSSAVAVRTDRSALLALTGDTDDMQAQNTPVIVLQLRGQFPTMYPGFSLQKQPGSDKPVPVPSASPRTATVITESMSLDLGKVYDAATQYSDSRTIDLSKLDAPMVNIPVS